MTTTEVTVKEQWQKIEETLGHLFCDRALLAEAMTHRSYTNEHHCGLPDNERLEFLGDAVFDLVISQYLMNSLPESTEGDLSRIRAEVRAMPSLANMARSLDLGSSLLLGRGEENSGGRNNDNLLADALEALFGAIFTDGGFDKARAAILPLVMPFLQQVAVRDGKDYKSRLQETLQAARRGLPVYHLVEVCGPEHERTYRVDAMIEGHIYGSGEGRTKKVAEQAAAKEALASLDKQS
jgi:ribonuclease-3